MRSDIGTVGDKVDRLGDRMGAVEGRLAVVETRLHERGPEHHHRAGRHGAISHGRSVRRALIRHRAADRDPGQDSVTRPVRTRPVSDETN